MPVDLRGAVEELLKALSTLTHRDMPPITAAFLALHVAGVRKALAEHRDEVDQMRVQLAGVSVAAGGGTSEAQRAKQGGYGWSVAYQDTLELRLKHDSLESRIEQLQARDTETAELLDRLINIACRDGFWREDAFTLDEARARAKALREGGRG